MILTTPSLNWERLDDVFYRMRTCHTFAFDEELDLAQYRVAVAPFGTAIAIYPKQNHPRYAGTSSKTFTVLSGAGEVLHTVAWNESKGGEVAGFGWSATEDLVVVSKWGQCRVYYDFEDNFSEHELSSRVRDGELACIKFTSDNRGFVAQFASGDKFVVVADVAAPRPRILPFSVGDGAGSAGNTVHDWAVLAPHQSLSHTTELLVAKSSTLYSVTEAGVENRYLTEGPFEFVEASPSGALVCLFSRTARAGYVMTASLQRKITQFVVDAETATRATSVAWCADDVVVLRLGDDELRVVGPGETHLTFFYDGPITLHRDFDGVRVVGSEKVEFFSKVAPVSVDIFKIGSTSPAAILLDALDLRGSSDPTENVTALENLSLIAPALTRAIESCIAAATEEFDAYWQKKLLRAANFAKSNLDLYNSEQFVEAVRNLKILNELRSHRVGMFLTYREFTAGNLGLLVKLLLKRKQYLLALKICNYLHLPVDAIYIDWCCDKISKKAELSDEELFEIVLGKLRNVKNISFEPISRAAFQQGRDELAIKLINYEPNLAKKIPVLLEMQQYELAMMKAETFLDYKLMEYVILLFQREKAQNTSEFLKVVSMKKRSLHFWEALMKRAKNWDVLQSYYKSFDDKIVTLGNLYMIAGLAGTSDLSSDTRISDIIEPIETSQNIVSEADDDSELRHKMYRDKRAMLNKAIESYEQLKHNNKEVQDDLRYLRQELRLVETQEAFEKTFVNLRFFGKSIIETLTTLILINNYDTNSESSVITKKINKFLKDFRIPEKRYYHLVVEKLSEYKKWSELYSFANLKKSPIGYEPFYKICIKNNAIRQAGLYIDLIGNGVSYNKKVKMYLRVGNFKSASEVAYKNKDLARLTEIYNLYKNTSHPNSVVVQLIEGYIRVLK